MKAKNLSYNVTKFYVGNGVDYKMNVHISLGDFCKNGICDWSITADIYEKRRNGRYVYVSDGCCHEEILKYFPEFKSFVQSLRATYVSPKRNIIHYVIVQRIRHTIYPRNRRPLGTRKFKSYKAIRSLNG